MADQRDEKQGAQDQQSSGGKRVVGRGMTSPDSTEAVLDASTGEPDPRARGDAAGESGKTDKNRESGNR